MSGIGTGPPQGRHYLLRQQALVTVVPEIVGPAVRYQRVERVNLHDMVSIQPQAPIRPPPLNRYLQSKNLCWLRLRAF